MSALYLQPDNVSFHRQQLLVSGYLLECSGNLDTIPYDLINLCLLFYTEIIHWNIKERELRAFITAEQQYKLYSTVFVQQNIEMKCAIISHPDKSNEFWFQALMPSPITSRLIVHFHVYCVQTRRNVKYTAHFNQGNKRLKDGWSTIHLPLFDVTPYQYLNLRIHADVLQVEQTADANQKDAETAQPALRSFYREIQMKRRLQFEWRVGDDLLDVFPDCPVSKGYFSHNFDDENQNWSLLCLPHGRAGAAHSVLVMLAINRLPRGIHEVEVEYVISNNLNETVISRRNKFSYAWWTHYSRKTQALFDSDMLQSVDRDKGLIFGVQIELVALYTKDPLVSINASEPIAAELWQSYGIVD